MTKKKDPRINAKTMSKKQYGLLLLVLLLILGGYTGNYLAFGGSSANPENQFYMSLSMIGYLLFVALIFLFFFEFIRRRYLLKPTRILGDAARKVAEGDYSVRVQGLRKDGKKDEFEVLFEDFNTMVEELGSTEMLKKDFISNVSHELKTPLSVIANYATMLQSKDLSEEERISCAKTVSDAAQRLSVLVTNILQMSRLDNQKIPVNAHSYNLSEQISRCAIGFEQIWEEKDIELEVNLDQNIILHSDEELLDIVWNNLISNALKFTEPGGKVNLTAIQNGEEIIVTVSDSGCGMDEADMKHIFDKFYQADTSHATKGNGLGLALVKSIVELVNGEISVHSEIGKGTTFTVKMKAK